MTRSKQRVEFGDWQTPIGLALLITERLKADGLRPEVIIEPTCGLGAFVQAAAGSFPEARLILGYDINADYINALEHRVEEEGRSAQVRLHVDDFFAKDWRQVVQQESGELLVIGNPPWVTSAGLGSIGGTNLPGKSNFQSHSGFDAMTGKANFDISEHMMMEMVRWFRGRQGTLAMLCKTAVARKVLAHAHRQRAAISDAYIAEVDTKKHFDAAVDSCLLVIRFLAHADRPRYDYVVYPSLDADQGYRVGHRAGLLVRDVEAFDEARKFVGKSPQKWRSGIKHDASSIMEFERQGGRYVNGLGEAVDLEPDFLYPLLKGSDVANAERAWRERFVLVTQRAIGEDTSAIRRTALRTWAYLEHHRQTMEARGSRIYQSAPAFSIFGVGEYAFRPWRIAICGLYKALRFRLVGPIEGRPVMFDDTVYYISFDTEQEAREVHERISAERFTKLYASLIFWDEKRPIKTSILNVVDWSKEQRQAVLFE